MPIVELQHVRKAYDTKIAVADLSFTIEPGTMFGLLGPNGSGKTSSIRMMIGITVPDSGTVNLFGQPFQRDILKRVGYLPEERGLYKKMKIVDQLRFFGALKNLKGNALNETIDRWLERVKLTEWKNKKASELSKGMQQKIQFIAAVMHDPDLIILDEPFSGLDPINVELLKEIVLELKATGKTIIFSTHQMEVAEKICDDICLINRSRKVLEGSIRHIKEGFGRNSVALRVVGGDGVLNNPELVAKITEHSDEVEALLHVGADAQELLRQLVAAGATVTKFELVEPSLNDIFIIKVGEADA
jgi:ABC-2 type transport system ATP-binding protein